MGARPGTGHELAEYFQSVCQRVGGAQRALIQLSRDENADAWLSQRDRSEPPASAPQRIQIMLIMCHVLYPG